MNLIEELRKNVINSIFTMKSFKKSWDTWKNEIYKYAPTPTPREIFDLGDHLREIFLSTNIKNRSQSTLSSGGYCWEALVCWYLNICLVDTKTVVVKPTNTLLPTIIKNAITLKYKSYTSATESDLIAITFLDDYFLSETNDTENITEVINQYLDEPGGMANIDIHIIQCKTNWNDNAQIPMLWDIVYKSVGFPEEDDPEENEIQIGTEGTSIVEVNKFTYSFITVPTTNPKKLTAESTPVKRVYNLSGGNYWGMKSKNAVAFSIKEIINKNFQKKSCLTTIKIDKLRSLKYFNFPFQEDESENSY